MRTNFVVPLLLCSGFAAMPAVAQVNSSESLDQIIVTGARAPINVNQVGSATTVISRQQIERRQARYVTDVLRTVPGFSISHTGVIGSQTQVRVRGSEANHVLVLINGVRANDPATGDEFRWEHLATGNVERIEIVRGPQSALWGSDAIGAVVNVITRQSSDQPSVDVYAEGGANDSANFGANGAISIGDWGVNAGVELLDTDGENISREGTESDGAELASGSLGIRYDTAGPLTLSAGLKTIDAMSQFDAVDFFTTGLPVDGDVETRSSNLVGNFDASLTTNDDRIVWHLLTRYFDSEHRDFVDNTQGSSTASERISYGLQSDISLGDDRLVLAIEHEDTDFEQRGAVVFGDPNQNQEMQVSSAIAEYQYLTGNRISWTVGARFDSNSDFDDALTGKVSMAYRWTDETRLRASIGTGQKTPTFTERFGFFPGQFVGNPGLKPEESVSYEVGLDTRFYDGDLSLQGTVYFQDLTNEINGFVFDPVTFLSTAENRSGSSDRSGIELAAQWQLSDQFGATASYTYTDSSEQDTTGASSRELRRPRHAGSVALDFVTRNDRFQAMLVADYGGTRQDLFFPPFPEPQQIVTLGNYWLIDLTAQYRVSDSVKLFVRTSNLLDEDYEQVFGYRTPGRGAYVGIRTDFGR